MKKVFVLVAAIVGVSLPAVVQVSGASSQHSNGPLAIVQSAPSNTMTPNGYREIWDV